MSAMYCTVVTASRSSSIGNGLTYAVEEGVVPGSPVRVPLRNKTIEGVVFEILDHKDKEQFAFKQVTEILGNEPLVMPAHIQTMRWMSEHYLCTLRQALSVWLPPLPWSAVLPREEAFYTSTGKEMVDLRGKKQLAILESLQGRDGVSREELQRTIGATAANLKTLEEKGFISSEKRRADSKISAPRLRSTRAPAALTPVQEAAYEAMKKDPRPSLLFGVTGSGKTEVYAKLISDTVSEGRQAILLVPEILLTAHYVERLTALLEPGAVAIVHSKISEAQRRNIWKRIHAGEISLVLGSRSALFAPLKDLGLIIIDEEHEWTYKNEQAPRYHARETAETLAKFSGAKLVFGTATPSLETWSRTKNGRYHIARLPNRYRDLPLPTVRVIDLAEAQFGSLYPFTKPLLDAIGDRLHKKEQSVLFLNRRGVASAILCLKCRRRVICTESQLPFTLHHTSKGRPFLLDHTTGLMADVPKDCPHCQSVELRPIGAGTQKIEIILRKQFPYARLIRADSDTLQRPEDMHALLQTMRNNEADILLGTQAVVKGLDLPNVTLAAVILADVGLSLPHFRAGERIFQLLTQLTGRSGRARPGEVIIQTFRPEAPEVLLAAKHETETYMENELKLRQWTQYPPSTDMIRLLLRGDDPGIRAQKLRADALKKVERDHLEAKVHCAPTFFGGGKEWQVLLRGRDVRLILSSLDLQNVSIDIDPMETV